MKPTVMTTGPGVIIATATASTNCRWGSHRRSRTTPPYRNGITARPLPNTKAPARAKNQAIAISEVAFPATAIGTANGRNIDATGPALGRSGGEGPPRAGGQVGGRVGVSPQPDPNPTP